MSSDPDDLHVEVRRISPSAALPAYQTDAAAGADLTAALEAPLTIEPGGRALVPTGIAVSLPIGTEGQVRPRSGLAVKHGVTVLNAPGTIDADYRGEVRVLLVNLGPEPYVVEPGARIAQLVVARCERASFSWVERLDETSRGAGGFGSTGR